MLYLGNVVKHQAGLVLGLVVQFGDIRVVELSQVVAAVVLGLDVVQATDLHLDLLLAQLRVGQWLDLRQVHRLDGLQVRVLGLALDAGQHHQGFGYVCPQGAEGGCGAG